MSIDKKNLEQELNKTNNNLNKKVAHKIKNEILLYFYISSIKTNSFHCQN